MAHWLHPVLVIVVKTEVIVHKADEPDAVSDLAEPHELATEDR